MRCGSGSQPITICSKRSKSWLAPSVSRETRYEVSAKTPSRRREQVVPGVELEHGGRSRDLDPRLDGKADGCRVVAQLRIDVGIDPAQADRPRRLGRELPVGLRDAAGEVERVAHLPIERRGIAAEAVEVEIDFAGAGADRRAQPTLEPAAGIGGERPTGPVLGAEGADGRDVGPRPAFASGLLARPQEHARQAAAVADRRLGDDDRDRQETPGVGEKVAEVELTVLRIHESGEALTRCLGCRLRRLGPDGGGRRRSLGIDGRRSSDRQCQDQSVPCRSLHGLRSMPCGPAA